MTTQNMVARMLATLMFLVSVALTACSETPPGTTEAPILITVQVDGAYNGTIQLTVTDKESEQGPTSFFDETLTCTGDTCTVTFGNDPEKQIPHELPQGVQGYLRYKATELPNGICLHDTNHKDPPDWIPVMTQTIELTLESCDTGTTDSNATTTDTMSGSMSNSESATDTTPTGTATDTNATDSGTGTMTATETDGTISGSGTDSNTDSNGTDTDSGTDSMGTDSNGTTMGTDSGTMSGTDSTSMGTDSNGTTGSTGGTDSTTGSTTDNTTGSTGDTDSTTGNPVVDPFTPCHRPNGAVNDNTIGNGLQSFGTNKDQANLGVITGHLMGDQCMPLDFDQANSLECILSPSLLANGTFTLMGLTVKLAIPGNIPNNVVLAGTMSCTSDGGYNGAFVLNAQAMNKDVAKNPYQWAPPLKAN